MQVGRWRTRYAEGGLAAIAQDPAARRTDAPSPTADAAEIVRLTTRTTPEAATQWSTRSLAAKVGVSGTTVLRVWRKHGLRPHLVRGFNISRDAKFIVKLEDIMELYMAPPEHALALCCDEKSQVQALVLHS
ncbi:helix-turn-helix domain-containing protein [Metallibacterium sp.]|uniref:helix-turn-helix domain-containing protein n=1 Tax=Metallibacterium sp. TaxID=2940281 RepID=UPI0026369FA6|nr:helix-turn-helix domain-containing protein [Metallibacterium sp.]